jgi:hypothetical protein
MNPDPVQTFAIIGLIFIIGFIVLGITYSARHRELNHFASTWRGRITHGGPWDFPQVTLQLGDNRTTLSYSHHGEEIQTHLTIAIYDVRVRLELRPQGITQRLGKYFGMQDIEVGDDDFDAAFIIQGSNEKGIREFLAPSVRAAIMSLATCGTDRRFDLHLQLGGGSLRVTKHEHLTTAAALSDFVRCCYVLLRHIQKPIADGIEFVEQAPTIATKDTECQVCGDPLLEKVVFCMKCKTPHHLDCWQYFGTCSVYGCGHKRYIVFRK